MYSSYTKMFGMCQGSTPAATDCRTFVAPALKSYYRPPPAEVKPAPNDEERLAVAWGKPSLNSADAYRYDQFEGAVVEETKKDITDEEKKKENFSFPSIRLNRSSSA